MRSKKKIKRFIKNYLPTISSYWKAIKAIKNQYAINEKKIGRLGKNSDIALPASFDNPKNVFIDDYVRIQPNSRIINHNGKFIIKRYSAIAANFVAIPNNHISTVGIPQYILGPSHINDIEGDIIIEESVWIGANVVMLQGASRVGRGAVIGACSLVNKPIPPYAVAVGIPAKIVASTFSIDQILEHEKAIYPKEERFSKEYLEQLFTEHFQEKKSFGTSYISEKDKSLLDSIKKELNIKNYE